MHETFIFEHKMHEVKKNNIFILKNLIFCKKNSTNALKKMLNNVNK